MEAKKERERVERDRVEREYRERVSREREYRETVSKRSESLECGSEERARERERERSIRWDQAISSSVLSPLVNETTLNYSYAVQMGFKYDFFTGKLPSASPVIVVLVVLWFFAAGFWFFVCRASQKSANWPKSAASLRLVSGRTAVSLQVFIHGGHTETPNIALHLFPSIGCTNEWKAMLWHGAIGSASDGR